MLDGDSFDLGGAGLGKLVSEDKVEAGLTFDHAHLLVLLGKCKVEIEEVRSKRDAPKAVCWSASDFGVYPKSRKIYERNLGYSRAARDEFNRFMILHELAHIVFWTGLGVECPEGLLIAWENRILSAAVGRGAALIHLYHPYTNSSPIARQRRRGGRSHLDKLAYEFGDLTRQAWWAVAEDELDKMGLKGDLDSLVQPINKSKLKSAMIRIADAQDFELPTRYTMGRKRQHG